MNKARRKGERGGHNYKQGGEEGRKVGRRELGWWTCVPPTKVTLNMKVLTWYINLNGIERKNSFKYLYPIGSYKF